MNARSALFDVYGDHLRSRGGAAPVASLVAMLAPLGISAPAVRTALVTSGAITQRLDRLEERGLITRGRSDADGRAVVVTLTPEGRAALDAALPDHLETEHGMLAGLTADERAQLAALLRRWLVALGRVPGNTPDPS